jgi:hypothetical protein
MFEQTFKNIDDILHKDAGCTSELDYTEQSSWLLFLKYLDALEADRAAEAELEGRAYSFILAEPFRWERWAAPKNAEGRLDHHTAFTGDDLRDFVNTSLFPYLAGFKQRASGPNTIEYKIGEVFGEIKNKIQSGYSLRDVIDLVDQLRFRSQTEKHELSHLYEAKIKNMGNAGRNGGEYYTPRPLIRAMIRVLDPKIGERIYDGACGSAGFLCEAFEFLSAKAATTDDLATLQTRTFYGREKKSLAYVIGVMNMILHGIEAPNIVHTNTLGRTILRGGEVLVNVRGTLGGVAVVPDFMAGLNVSREVAVVPIGSLTLNPEYAAFWIGSRASQDWLSGVKKGAAYTGINIEDLRNVPVPVTSHDAQSQIVDDLKAARAATRKIEEIYSRKLAALDELKQSLLHQAFSGQL